MTSVKLLTQRCIRIEKVAAISNTITQPRAEVAPIMVSRSNGSKGSDMLVVSQFLKL